MKTIEYKHIELFDVLRGAEMVNTQAVPTRPRTKNPRERECFYKSAKGAFTINKLSAVEHIAYSIKRIALLNLNIYIL
ncbi:MAG: hypothetical protein ACK5IQ_08495 [Bacteroidales bacterium]